MAAPKMQLRGRDGIVREAPVYVDRLELEKDYFAGEVKAGDEIVYMPRHPMVVEVMGDFKDQDGEAHTMLLWTGMGM